MTVPGVRTPSIEEMETLIVEAPDFRDILMEEYLGRLRALRWVGSTTPMKRLFALETMRLDMERRLPDVTDQEFECHVAVLQMDGAAYEACCEVPRVG